MNRPNVLIFSTAPLRAENLTCYGYPRDTTPHLDRLAREGTLFERAYATSTWTPPSHASLLCGLLPASHGVTAATGLKDAVPTMASLLTGLGYHTAGWTTTSLIGRYKRLDRGFKEFSEPWQQRVAAEAETGGARALAERVWRNVLALPGFGMAWRSLKHRAWRSGLIDKGAHRTTRRVVDWLRSYRRQRPFFLFVHYQEMHHPYLAPRPFRHRYTAPLRPRVDRRKLRRINANPYLYSTGVEPAGEHDLEMLKALYDGEIRYTDDHLGRLLAALRELGVLDETVVIALAPHGENIGEHGLCEHQGGLYDTTVHVPLVLRYPAAVPAGLRISSLVQLTDVLPTVLELAGRHARDLMLQGQSLLPLEPNRIYRRYAIAEYEGNFPISLRQVLRGPERPAVVDRYTRRLAMIVQGHYKYISGSDGSEELFHLARDPEELENLCDRDSERATAMAEQLDAALSAVKRRVGRPDPEPEKDVLEELRTQGYRL